jgi:hypothetical protein
VNLGPKGGQNLACHSGCNGVWFLLGEGGKIEDPLTLEGGRHDKKQRVLFNKKNAP